MRVRFGECVFDSEVRQVTVAGRAVGLSPRALELLALLLAHRPQAMRQAELRDRLWPGTVVSYTSLARLVTELRRAVGDRRRQPRFIRTVHGFGYAFCGEANEIFRPPARTAFTCSLVWGTREIARDLALALTQAIGQRDKRGHIVWRCGLDDHGDTRAFAAAEPYKRSHRPERVWTRDRAASPKGSPPFSGVRARAATAWTIFDSAGKRGDG